MNGVVCCIKGELTAGDGQFVFDPFPVSGSLQPLAAHGIAVERLIGIAAERLDIENAVVDRQGCFRLNGIPAGLDPEGSSVDGDLPDRNGIGRIGNGFNAVVIGGDVKAAPR